MFWCFGNVLESFGDERQIVQVADRSAQGVCDCPKGRRSDCFLSVGACLLRTSQAFRANQLADGEFCPEIKPNLFRERELPGKVLTTSTMNMQEGLPSLEFLYSIFLSHNGNM